MLRAPEDEVIWHVLEVMKAYKTNAYICEYGCGIIGNIAWDRK